MTVFRKYLVSLCAAISGLALVPMSAAANPMADIDRETLTNLLVAAPGLSRSALEHGLKAARCAAHMNESDSSLLTIIDYSRPSKEKRMWVLDIARDSLVYNEWVAHGVNSGNFKATKFSNRVNSRQTSLGVYRTAETYSGKHGYSLKLDGLDGYYNNRARERAIVIHGASYVDERGARKTGRVGRSWGCPALRKSMSRKVINTIKNGSLVVAYYPQQDWMRKSAFLNCPAAALPQQSAPVMQVVQGDSQPPRLLLMTPASLAERTIAAADIQKVDTDSVTTNRYFESPVVETVADNSADIPVVQSFTYDIDGYVAERPVAFGAAASVNGEMAFQSKQGNMAFSAASAHDDYAFDSGAAPQVEVDENGAVVQSVADNDVVPTQETREYRFSGEAAASESTSFSFLQ